MDKKKKVSKAVISRLPRYYRYLRDLHDAGIQRISSKELSQQMKATASQVRQDLNCFGGFGQQGYGYNVEFLYLEIGKILNVEEGFQYIIVGAGNMGKAICNHESFRKRGYELVGIFDRDPLKIGTKVNAFEVKDFEKMEAFLENQEVQMAMLCVPDDVTNEVVDYLYEKGVKGYLNFSSADIKIREDLVVENVHLSDTLMVLGYNLGNVLRTNKEI
jgi:redox-sensing transcriptional repressor